MNRVSNNKDYFVEDLTNDIMNDIIRENYDNLMKISKKAPDSKLLCISYPSLNSLLRRIKHNKPIDCKIGILRCHPCDRLLKDPIIIDSLNDQNKVCVFICINRPKNRSSINICSVKSIILAD